MNPGDDGVAISRVVETAASWDGAPLPSYPRGAPRVTILRATVPPHTALAMHTHALVNAGVILRGELTVIAETGAQRMFRAGEGIVELVGTRHYGENRGDGELELVMFYAGTQGMSPSLFVLDDSTPGTVRFNDKSTVVLICGLSLRIERQVLRRDVQIGSAHVVIVVGTSREHRHGEHGQCTEEQFPNATLFHKQLNFRVI